MDKSYVTLEQQVCVVCGAPFDTGSLLLDRRLKPVFEHHTVTGWGMCPDHQKMKDDGYVALVGCKPPSSGDTIQPGDADRTGRLAHLKLSAWERVFNVPPPEKGVCFVDDAVIEMLRNRVQNQPKEKTT